MLPDVLLGGSEHVHSASRWRQLDVVLVHPGLLTSGMIGEVGAAHDLILMTVICTDIAGAL